MSEALPLTKGERTRAHIVATAASLFWRRSFHGVSVDEIARVAEVNKATVYRYFADKNALALAVTQYQGAMSLDLIFAHSQAVSDTPQDRLSAVYRAVYCTHQSLHEAQGDVFGCPIVGLALELGHELPELRSEASRLFETVENFMKQIAADAFEIRGTGGDAEATGRTLTQLLHGAHASARLAANPAFVLDAGRASLALIGFPDTPILKPEHDT